MSVPSRDGESPVPSKSSVDRPLPVFPVTDDQVAEVANAPGEKLHWTRDDERAEELAWAALKAVARVMHMEHQADPQGAPRGYGYREVRAVTPWITVAPDGTWRPPDA